MRQDNTAGDRFMVEAETALDQLARSRREVARLKAIQASTGDAVIAVSGEGIIWECNRAAERLFGYSAAEMTGKSVDALISPIPDGAVFSSHVEYARRSERSEVEGTVTTRDGTSVAVAMTVIAMPLHSTDESGVTLVIQDPTQGLRAERELKQSLIEKDTLLREVHHRVKNNLQIICSMLRLQSSYLPEGGAREMFRSSEERVYAMGLVHDKLYRSTSYSSVDVAGYVEELGRQLTRPYLNAQGARASVEINVVPSVLPLDRAVPFGLLVNELLSNALKYGFSEDGSRSVAVSLSRIDSMFRLLVCDCGRGLPEGFVLSQPRTLGLRLVHALSQQLYGQLSYRYDGGAHFCVEFPSLQEGTGTDGFRKSDLNSHL